MFGDFQIRPEVKAGERFRVHNFYNNIIVSDLMIGCYQRTNVEDSRICLINTSGYYAGQVELVLPSEAQLSPITLSAHWLHVNWSRWVKEIDANDVRIGRAQIVTSPDADEFDWPLLDEPTHESLHQLVNRKMTAFGQIVRVGDKQDENWTDLIIVPMLGDPKNYYVYYYSGELAGRYLQDNHGNHIFDIREGYGLLLNVLVKNIKDTSGTVLLKGRRYIQAK